jgi:DNA-directed RNA polymerase
VKSSSQAQLERQQREWEAKRELENLEYEWETKSVEKAVERYKKISKDLKQLGLAFEILQGNDILGHWFEPLCAAIKAEQNAALLKTSSSASTEPKKPARGQRVNPKAVERELNAYLVTLPPEKLAVIAIHETMCEILRSHHPEGAPFAALAVAVGRAVEYEYNSERLAKEGWKPQLRNRSATPTRQQTAALIRTQSRAQYEDASWGSAMHAKMGSLLIQQLLNTATIARKIEEPDIAALQASPERLLSGRPRTKAKFVTNEEALLAPAFQHHQAMIKGKVTGFITCHEQVLALMDQEEVQRGIMQARYMPMLVPPQPWTAPNQGGYLVARTQVLRAKGSRMQTEVLRSASMDKVYECLNLLSSTPWHINNRMYQVICEAWDNGGDIADLPSRTNVVRRLIPQLHV